MLNSQISVTIRQHEHCNIDSFPLRFGFCFNKDMNCQLLLEGPARSDTRYGERYIYDATLVHPETDERYSGTFVVAVERGQHILVTAWRNDIDTEYYLSEVMKLLRKSGVLNTDDLLGFHPRYKRNELTSHASLVLALSENKSSKQVAIIQEQAALAISQAEQKIEKLKHENEKLKLETVTLKQENQIQALQHQLEKVQSTRQVNTSTAQKRSSISAKTVAIGLVCTAGLILSGLGVLKATTNNNATDIWPPEGSILTHQALSMEGAHTNVCGKVVQIRDFAKGKYLNFDKSFPETIFTAVIWQNDVSHVLNENETFNAFSNREVCVSGQINNYNNRAQIIVSNPSQLQMR